MDSLALARHVRLAALLLAAVALSACSGSLSIDLTDTPVDNATSVVVDFTGIDLHNTNGKTTTITFPSPRQIDLLQLQNGATAALLAGEQVPTGSYDWIELHVLADKDTQGESYITFGTGAQYPLYIPSGSETALRLATSFKVAQMGTTRLILEIDLHQSVTSTDGQNYALVPALRLVDPREVGTLTATVDLAALAAQQLGSAAQVSQCRGGLFLFSGGSVRPQNGGGASLVDVQPIPFNGTTTQMSLSLPYVTKGNYTVAATCNYDLYDPTATPGQDGYQALHWMVQDNVSVTANTTAAAALPSRTSFNVVN